MRTGSSTSRGACGASRADGPAADDDTVRHRPRPGEARPSSHSRPGPLSADDRVVHPARDHEADNPGDAAVGQVDASAPDMCTRIPTTDTPLAVRFSRPVAPAVQLEQVAVVVAPNEEDPPG